MILLVLKFILEHCFRCKRLQEVYLHVYISLLHVYLYKRTCFPGRCWDAFRRDAFDSGNLGLLSVSKRHGEIDLSSTEVSSLASA